MKIRLSRFAVFLGVIGLLAVPVTAQSLTLTPDSITLQNGVISGSYEIQSTLDNMTVSTDLNLHGNTIYNLSRPTLPHEAATKAYVDDRTGANLSVVLGRGNSAGGLIIENYGNVSDSNTDAVADVGYVQNYIDQNNADGDSDSANELQNITINSASIDDVINLDSGDSSTIYSSITLDDNFEADTDNQTLSEVLVYGALANQSINLNGHQLQNVVANSPGDAVNKSYVDSVSGGSDNQTLSFTANISGVDDNLSISEGNYVIVDDAYEQDTDNQDLSSVNASAPSGASSVSHQIEITNGQDAAIKDYYVPNGTDDQNLQATTRSGQIVTIPIENGADTSFTDENGTDNQTLAQVLSEGAVANTNIDMSGFRITGIPAPNSGGDAVNKTYVDNQISQAGSDDQTLTVSNNTDGRNDSITIQNGNTVTVRDDFQADTDNQGLGNVLSVSNDAGSTAILNLSNSTQSQAAVTYSQLKGYVASNNADADASQSNEIQNLTEVLGQGNNANGKLIVNYGSPSDSQNNVVADVGWVKNYVSSSSNADADSDPENELQNLTVNSGSTNDVIEINSGDSSTVRDSITIQDNVNAIQADLVAGNGLSGTSNNVLPGTDADVSLSLASSVAGAQLNYSSGTLSVYEGSGSGLNADLVDGNELSGLAGNGVSWDSANSEYDAADSSASNEVQNLTEVLAQGANANGTVIDNYGTPSDSNNDAVADLGWVKNYVSANNADADADPSNELQNLSINSTNVNDVLEINNGDSSTVRDSVTFADNYIGKSGPHQSGGVLDMNGFNITDSTRGNVSVNDSIKVYGNIYTNGADLAENYRSSQELEKGEIVTVSSTQDNRVVRSDERFDGKVLGVVSTDPGQTMNSDVDGYPVALTGKVPVKVSDVNGDIERGDRIVPSGTPGVGMQCEVIDPMNSDKPLREIMSHNQDCRSSAIGKALEPESGEGKILVAVS
ncbi:MAG: beta strand repeat-containing protein [Candidatus Nanohalobium sp.]